MGVPVCMLINYLNIDVYNNISYLKNVSGNLKKTIYDCLDETPFVFAFHFNQRESIKRLLLLCCGGVCS